MANYELAILGDASAAERETLTNTISLIADDFNLDYGSDIIVRDVETLSDRDFRAASAATWFGGSSRSDVSQMKSLLRSRVPVVPTILEGCDFKKEVPSELHATNASFRRPQDKNLDELAGVLLECVGLLRRQRRVFVSYRRDEAKEAAVQLWEALGSRGFNAFLDTHNIRAGAVFQDELWHQLCDCDVMIMLDTPGYFDSKWTRSELGRARAKEIHVLRIIWPGRTSLKLLELGQDFQLTHSCLHSPKGPISPEVADRIILAVERVRSKSIASRYRSITGKIQVTIEGIGGSIRGIGAHRAISIGLVDGSIVWAYPAVGVPTAETLHDVSKKATQFVQGGTPIVVYDGVGLRDVWRDHLEWLDKNIGAVHAVSVADLGWTLAAWSD